MPDEHARASACRGALHAMLYSERDARAVAAWLITAELTLAAAYLLTAAVLPNVGWGPVALLFDIGRDLSIPSWFSSMQLFMVALVLLFAARNRHTSCPLTSRSLVVAAAAFAFLSADEGAGIHEQVTRVVRAAGLTGLLFRGSHGGWIAVYGVVVVLAAILAWRWLAVLWTCFRRETSIAAAGAVTYLTGAVGVEVLGYQFASGDESRVDAVRDALEELLEMAGVTLLLYAALLLALSVAKVSPATTESHNSRD